MGVGSWLADKFFYEDAAGNTRAKEWTYWIPGYGTGYEAMEYILGVPGAATATSVRAEYLNQEAIKARKREEYLAADPILALQAVDPAVIYKWLFIWEEQKRTVSKLYDAALARRDSSPDAARRDEFQFYMDYLEPLIENAEINASFLRMINQSRTASLSELRTMSNFILDTIVLDLEDNDQKLLEIRTELATTTA